MTPTVLHVAAELVAVDGLRAYAGVQLASALAAREADRSCDTFVAFDEALRQAAARRGFLRVPESPAD